MSHDKIVPTSKKISVAQRESLLWEASREYMRGNISASELKKIEHSTSLDSYSTSRFSKDSQIGGNQTTR